jgi:clathrin heavy chain
VPQLQVVELEREPGNPVFERKVLHVDFFQSTTYDYPLAILPSNVDGIIYILTKHGFLHLYDTLIGKHLHTTKISQVDILSTAEHNATGGVICMDSFGNISSVSVNREVLVPYVLTTLHGEKLAIQIARRADLPGAEFLFFQHFQQCILNGEFKEAATLAANAPRVRATKRCVGLY